MVFFAGHGLSLDKEVEGDFGLAPGVSDVFGSVVFTENAAALRWVKRVGPAKFFESDDRTMWFYVLWVRGG